MTYFLTTGMPPPQLRTDEKKRFAVRSRNFCLVDGVLYHKGSDEIWRRGVHEDEKETVLRKAHCGTAGGHYAGDVTARKVWQAGLWWPTTQKDAYRYCKQCDLCQRLGQPTEAARSANIAVGTIPKVGFGFCGPLYIGGRPHREQICFGLPRIIVPNG